MKLMIQALAHDADLRPSPGEVRA